MTDLVQDVSQRSTVHILQHNSNLQTRKPLHKKSQNGLSSSNTKSSHRVINTAVCRLPVHSQTHGKLQQSPLVPQHVVRHKELSHHSSSGVACPTGQRTKPVCCCACQRQLPIVSQLNQKKCSSNGTFSNTLMRLIATNVLPLR